MLDDTRVLQGTAATLTGTILDQYGEPVAPTGAVTVGVVDHVGNEIVAPGTATTSGTGVGEVTLTVPPTATASLGVLTATWTDAGDGSDRVTLHEIVGGYYASVAEIRGQDASLQDKAKYPDAMVRRARQLVESEFESICGQAFVPRWKRALLDVRCMDQLELPEPNLREVLAITSTDGHVQAGNVDEIPANTQGVILDAPIPARRVIVEYITGYDTPPPDVLGAFFTRVRDVINRAMRGVPDRSSSFTSSENGTFSLLVPGQRGSITGIGDVDVILMRYTAAALLA